MTLLKKQGRDRREELLVLGRETSAAEGQHRGRSYKGREQMTFYFQRRQGQL